MQNYNKSVEINHNPNSPPSLYRIFIISGLGSVKTNKLLNLTKHQQADVDKIYLKIRLNQSINYLSTEEKKPGLDMKKIQRNLLFIHKQLMVSMKI